MPSSRRAGVTPEWRSVRTSLGEPGARTVVTKLVPVVVDQRVEDPQRQIVRCAQPRAGWGSVGFVPAGDGDGVALAFVVQVETPVVVRAHNREAQLLDREAQILDVLDAEADAARQGCRSEACQHHEVCSDGDRQVD
jgi:hypothetical protein